jgi:tetratricopeptide (TPR) repeat protein
VAEVREDDRVGFRHPAFREVVYAELLPGERARLHRAAAEALTQELAPAPEVAGELARHWYLAGDHERALAASVEAGRAHERMYAFADAYASYRLALDLLDRLPADVDRVDLAARAAAAGSIAGESAAAARLLEAELERTDERLCRAILLDRLGSVHFVAGDASSARTAYRSAMGLLPESDESRLAARVYAGYALLEATWAELDEAEAVATHALAVSRALDARRPEGTALNALGLVAATRGDPIEVSSCSVSP